MPLIDKFGVGDPVGEKAAKILPQFAPADQHPHRVQIGFSAKGRPANIMTTSSTAAAIQTRCSCD